MLLPLYLLAAATLQTQPPCPAVDRPCTVEAQDPTKPGTPPKQNPKPPKAPNPPKATKAPASRPNAGASGGARPQSLSPSRGGGAPRGTGEPKLKRRGS